MAGFQTKKELARTPIRPPQAAAPASAAVMSTPAFANSTFSPSAFGSPMDLSSPFIIRRQSDSSDQSLIMGGTPFTPQSSAFTASSGLRNTPRIAQPLATPSYNEEGGEEEEEEEEEEQHEQENEEADGNTSQFGGYLLPATDCSVIKMAQKEDDTVASGGDVSVGSRSESDIPTRTIVKRLDFSNSSGDGDKTPWKLPRKQPAFFPTSTHHLTCCRP